MKPETRAWVAVLCGLLFALCGCGVRSPAPPDRVHEQPLRRVLFVTDEVDGYNEGRARLANLFEGIGLPFDTVSADRLTTIAIRDYQLLVVAATSEREWQMDDAAEEAVLRVLADGVHVLWIGRGIWGTGRTTRLPEAFGLRYLEQGWSTDFGVAEARFENTAGDREHLTVYKEQICKVTAVKADVDGGYLGTDGRALELPFITHYRAGEHSGRAAYISMSLLDYWKAAEADDAFARAEVLLKYIRRLTSQGTVGKHPVMDARTAVLMMRLEDYVPGGDTMGHGTRPWLLRMERLLQIAREHRVPVNIALVPLYRHPARNESRGWDDADAGVSILRRQAQQAFADGGSLIVHGYAHQNGSAPDDYSGNDWEMWDEDTQHFLPPGDQQKITHGAVAEVTRTWGIVRTVWETPHYVGNEDTYRAARAAGFLYCTESDTKMFPNRHGYLNRVAGELLNIPETAFNYPNDPDAIRLSGLIRQRSLLPRISRMNGLFYFFYHNTSVHQERALENLLSTASRLDLWKPGLTQYAEFWTKRQRVAVASRIDTRQRRIAADVTGSFAGMTLSIRLPDGASPGSTSVGGKAVSAKTRKIDGIWYVYPVLPDAEACQVVTAYQERGRRAPLSP